MSGGDAGLAYAYFKRRIKGFAFAALMFLSVLLPLYPAGERFLARAESPDGLVRVLLTRLALTDRLDAALDGSYTVEPGNISFQRGSKLTISSATGRLMLFYEGMALDAGEKLTLRRHAVPSGGENGLRLNGDYSLYAGDLVVTIKDGMLRAVLHSPMEEYLLGVVPYEMSDSFPLEALKAQAVTARTYALKRTGSSQDYDVVDNTNDQVFKGMIADNMRAAQAVKETEGVVGMFGGALADCYYTASNGGQTELIKNVWSGEDPGISVMKDDPYDLQNPMSVTLNFAVPKAPEKGDAELEPLMALIKNGLTNTLSALGYDSNPSNIRIIQVTGVTANTPRFAEPSRVMTKIQFAVRVEARRPVTGTLNEEESFLFAQTQTPQPSATPSATKWSPIAPVAQVFYVDLDVFPDVETATNLSINGGGNEIITIRETETSFVLEARRFGHGVGMSQRGAEWMAQTENATFDKILQFYYPHMKLVKMPRQASPLPPVDAAFLATPGPPATPTPRPTVMPVTQTPAPGQWQAKVTKIGENSTLNMRGEPSLVGPVIRQLYYGQILLVVEELPDGWLKVKTDVLEGYVMASFVEKVE